MWPTNERYETGDKVYYKHADSAQWKGPGVVIGQDGAVIFTFTFYIYVFSRHFFPKRLTLHSSYSFTFDQLLLSLGRHRGTDGTEAVRHRGSYVRVHHSRLRKTDDSHTVQEEVDKKGQNGEDSELTEIDDDRDTDSAEKSPVSEECELGEQFDTLAFL